MILKFLAVLVLASAVVAWDADADPNAEYSGHEIIDQPIECVRDYTVPTV